MSGIVNANRYRYQYVPPSSVAAQLGVNGGPGDYLHRLIFNVVTPGSADVILIDGPDSFILMDSAAQLQRGPSSVEFNIASRNGAFKLTTGAGVAVIAVGQTVG